MLAASLHADRPCGVKAAKEVVPAALYRLLVPLVIHSWLCFLDIDPDLGLTRVFPHVAVREELAVQWHLVEYSIFT